MGAPMEEFTAHFGEVADPRADNARHDFLEVIFIALAAVLCGAEDCTDMGRRATTPSAECSA
jgi:DDE_Tnp_1-associated